MAGGSRGPAVDRARARARSVAPLLLAVVVPWQAWQKSNFLSGHRSEPAPAQATASDETSASTSDADSRLRQGPTPRLPSGLKLVVFDLAGTTLDDMVNGQPLAPRVIRTALKGEGIEVSDEAITQIRGLEKKQAITQLCRNHFAGTDKAREANEVAERVYTSFSEVLAEQLREGPLREIVGTSAVFRALRARGAKVVIGSGFEDAVVRDVVGRLGWDVDGIVSSTRRPRPDAIYEAIGMADVLDVAQVLKVGDTVADIQEGKNAHVWTAAVLTGTQSEAMLRSENPDFVLNSIADMLALLPKMDGLTRAQEAPADGQESSEIRT